MLIVNLETAEIRSFFITEKFWAMVFEALNFRVLRGVISFERLIAMGILP